MSRTTGISQAEIQKALVGVRAFGELLDVPAPRLDQVIDRAKKDLEGGTDPVPEFPPRPDPPPTPAVP